MTCLPTLTLSAAAPSKCTEQITSPNEETPEEIEKGKGIGNGVGGVNSYGSPSSEYLTMLGFLASYD